MPDKNPVEKNQMKPAAREDFQGREPGPGIALIAGVGEGLGLAIARKAAREGLTVVMVARNLERLEKVVEGIEQAGGKAVARSADLRKEEDVIALFENVVAEFGAPNFVVFNAGAQYRDSILTTSASMFEKVWRLSCFAGFLVAREAARYMVELGHGTIIFTGATASLRGGDNFAAFASGKFALRGLTQSMARELGPKGVHVANVIIDGAIDMPAIHKRMPDLADRLPEDGLLNPDDIAETYLQIHRQARSAWSFEVDLRPWVEKF